MGVLGGLGLARGAMGVLGGLGLGREGVAGVGLSRGRERGRDYCRNYAVPV